jgi:hypothetical protein
MRYLVALWLALAGLTPAVAQVNLSIGINVPTYPNLVPVPGYPVYYAPGLPENYFFYDGLYWVFQNGNWYESHWYNGPWNLVAPDAVPLYVLRVPVRYYRHPPAFFRGWRGDAAPRWDEHYGHAWAEHHGDWNRWDRGHVPARAPLPAYQHRYEGQRYPREAAAQSNVHAQQYHYQPRDEAVRQHYERHQAAAPQQAQPRESRGQGQPQREQAHENRAPRGGNNAPRNERDSNAVHGSGG